MPDGIDHPLRRWRNAQEPPVSLVEFAERIGSSRTYLWKIEEGQAQPSLEFLRQLIAATGRQITADEIIWWRRSGASPATV